MPQSAVHLQEPWLPCSNQTEIRAGKFVLKSKKGTMAFKSNVASSQRRGTNNIGLPTSLQEKVKISRCNVDTSTIKPRLTRYTPLDGLPNAAEEAAKIESRKAHTRQRAKQGRLAAFQREIHQRVSIERTASPKSASEALDVSNNSSALSARNTNTPDAPPKSNRRKVPAVWQIKKRGRSQVPATHRALRREVEAVAVEGTVESERLRRELLTNESLRKAMMDAVGSASLTQEAFDAKFVQEEGHSVDQVLEVLLSLEASQRSPAPVSGLSTHNPDVLDWARERLSRCLSGDSGGLAQGHLDGATPSPGANRPSLGKVIEERAVPSPEEPEDTQESLNALIEREMDQQRSFLFAIAREREEGRTELAAARAGERKHQETLRSLGATHRELMKKIADHKIELPQL